MKTRDEAAKTLETADGLTVVVTTWKEVEYSRVVSGCQLYYPRISVQVKRGDKMLWKERLEPYVITSALNWHNMKFDIGQFLAKKGISTEDIERLDLPLKSRNPGPPRPYCLPYLPAH